jgi:hypothetical protein
MTMFTVPLATSRDLATKMTVTNDSTMLVNRLTPIKTSAIVAHLQLDAGKCHECQGHQANGDEGNA